MKATINFFLMLFAVALLAGCNQPAAVAAPKPKSKAAFFRIANFTSAPQVVSIAGLPEATPLDWGKASNLVKRRVGKVKVGVVEKNGEVDLKESGGTLFLLGDPIAPTQVLVDNETKKASKGQALLKVVNLSASAVSFEGLGEAPVKVEPRSGSMPAAQAPGIAIISCTVNGKKIEKSFNMGDETSNVAVLVKKGNGYEFVVLVTPEAMGIESMNASPGT